MSRKVFDCRDLPGDCTLTVSGEEAEVVEAQAQHAVVAHDSADGQQLRTWIRSLLTEEERVTTVPA